MVQVANAADSANYLPLKRYAEEVKHAVDKSVTTTTKPKSRSHSKSKGTEGVNLGVLFAALGGFVGLQHVCSNLPSPGSTSSGQGAAQHGQSSVRGAGGHPPTQKGSSRGKVTVGF